MFFLLHHPLFSNNSLQENILQRDRIHPGVSNGCFLFAGEAEALRIDRWSAKSRMMAYGGEAPFSNVICHVLMSAISSLFYFQTLNSFQSLLFISVSAL